MKSEGAWRASLSLLVYLSLCVRQWMAAYVWPRVPVRICIGVCVCVHYALGALLKHVSVTLIVLYVHALVHYTISEVKEVQILRVDMISASDGPTLVSAHDTVHHIE